jgi:hypothetical protein
MRRTLRGKCAKPICRHAVGLSRAVENRNAGNGGHPDPNERFRGLLGRIHDPQKIVDRVADLVLILDSFDQLPDAVPGLEGKIDAKHIGVAGHTFGAYAAMLTGGVTADLGDWSKTLTASAPASGRRRHRNGGGMPNQALEQTCDGVLRYGERVGRRPGPHAAVLKFKNKNPREGRCCRPFAGVFEAEAPVGVEPTMADLQSEGGARFARR